MQVAQGFGSLEFLSKSKGKTPGLEAKNPPIGRPEDFLLQEEWD